MMKLNIDRRLIDLALKLGISTKEFLGFKNATYIEIEYICNLKIKENVLAYLSKRNEEVFLEQL